MALPLRGVQHVIVLRSNPARWTVMLTAQAEAAMRWHETSGTSMVVIQSVAHAALPDLDLFALPGRTGLNGTRARSHRLALLSRPACTGEGNPPSVADTATGSTRVVWWPPWQSAFRFRTPTRILPLEPWGDLVARTDASKTTQYRRKDMNAILPSSSDASKTTHFCVMPVSLCVVSHLPF
jgi:hypothetical protein